jgi:hypothetical protein
MKTKRGRKNLSIFTWSVHFGINVGNCLIDFKLRTQNQRRRKLCKIYAFVFVNLSWNGRAILHIECVAVSFCLVTYISEGNIALGVGAGTVGAK